MAMELERWMLAPLLMEALLESTLLFLLLLLVAVVLGFARWPSQTQPQSKPVWLFLRAASVLGGPIYPHSSDRYQSTCPMWVTFLQPYPNRND